MSSTTILILCLCLSTVFAQEADSQQHQHHDNSTQNREGTDVAKTEIIGEQRQCPGCVNPSGCDAGVKTSSLPILQILIALGAGIIWTLIFIYVFKNFTEKSGAGGSEVVTPQYGVPVAPQYGVPQSQYGAPPQSSYGAPSSRAFNLDFLELTKNVWEAIKHFSES